MGIYGIYSLCWRNLGIPSVQINVKDICIGINVDKKVEGTWPWWARSASL